MVNRRPARDVRAREVRSRKYPHIDERDDESAEEITAEVVLRVREHDIVAVGVVTGRVDRKPVPVEDRALDAVEGAERYVVPVLAE